MGSGAFVKVVAKNFGVLARHLNRNASVKTIETKSPDDDQQWLTYRASYILSYTKLIFMCWLVLPYFSGAAYVYQHFVRPLYVNHQRVNIWYVPRNKNIVRKPDDVQSAAEKYIEENGTDAFEKLL